MPSGLLKFHCTFKHFFRNTPKENFLQVGCSVDENANTGTTKYLLLCLDREYKQ